MTEIPAIELEYAFSVRIDFKERHLWQTPVGKRGWVPATGGEIWGPRLQGRVVPYSGADYADAYGLNAHYVLEAADGSLIYIHNRGYLRQADGESFPQNPKPARDSESYFRITPQFDAPAGPHDWLNRTVIVGTGQRHAEPDHTIFTYYAVL
jgi:Protein of unknown function (DUF3237)